MASWVMWHGKIANAGTRDKGRPKTVGYGRELSPGRRRRKSKQKDDSLESSLRGTDPSRISNSPSSGNFAILPWDPIKLDYWRSV